MTDPTRFLPYWLLLELEWRDELLADLLEEWADTPCSTSSGTDRKLFGIQVASKWYPLSEVAVN